MKCYVLVKKVDGTEEILKTRNPVGEVFELKFKTLEEALKKIGLDHNDYTDDIDPEDPDYAAMFDRKTYINLMFNIVKHYVPNFEWKPFTFEKGPGDLCIEGKAYGLWD